MNRRFFKCAEILLACALLVLCQSSEKRFIHLPSTIDPKFTEYPFNCSIRALEVVDENTVWFAGDKGMYGYTKDGGATWETDSITMDGNLLEFRAIAITKKAAFLLNVGSPAFLQMSTDQGKSWKVVYMESHPDVFYDCMKFWNEREGIAMGDPTDTCLSILLTNDGGASWRKTHCSKLPPTRKGEVAFAASNSNISLVGDHAWIATGGMSARVFHSPDKGRSWEVFETPMQQGRQMTGIFTIDFYDQQSGIVFGGDWEDQSKNTGNKALTSDGGKTWQLLSDGTGPGYRSCVRYIPEAVGKGIVAVGIPGISYSADGGTTWQDIDKTYYYTIRFASSRLAWLAGKNKVAKMQF